MNMLNTEKPKLALPAFELQPGETLLYQTSKYRPWYVIGWKVLGGVVTIILLTVASWLFFSKTATGLFSNILPSTTATASVLTQILCLGLVPLLVTAWAVEDITRTIIGKFVLTDKRLWVLGSPYAWNVTETPLEEIVSLNYRRDAVFIRQKSSRKLLVHMLSDGKLLAKVYKDYLGKAK